MNACVAIDWEPSNAAGMTCWILTLRYIRNTTEIGFIAHYVLHRPCTSQYYHYYHRVLLLA